MEKLELPILQFRTWNKKILLFDQYQKILENYLVAKKFALLMNEKWLEDKKVLVFANRLDLEGLWPVNKDKEKRGIDLLELDAENLFIVSDGYLYFDEDKLVRVLPNYLARVLLEWLPFKSKGLDKLAAIEEAFLLDDLLGIQSIYSLAGVKLGNSRLWANKLRKYLLEKAGNLGNLR